MREYCWRCGERLPGPRRRLCDACLKPRAKGRDTRRDRPTPTERGYGPEHQKLRRQLEPLVRAGAAVCWRCGEPIAPGEEWDLGHDDEDRSIYRGPEHLRCNRATTSRRLARRTSRRW